MRRGLIAVDRIAGFILAAVLLAAGSAAFAWHYDLIPGAPARLEFANLTAVANTSWWSLVTGAGGAVLVLLGVAWLARHLPRRGTGQLRLAGSDSTGQLTADPGAAAEAAGQNLALTPGVRGGSGRIVRDRGQLVVELHLTLEPTADLAVVQSAAAQAAADLHRILGHDELRHRIDLRVARTDKSATATRVH